MLSQHLIQQQQAPVEPDIALEFDGADFVNVNSGSSLETFTSGLTVSAWVYNGFTNKTACVYEQAIGTTVNTRFSLFFYTPTKIYWRVVIGGVLKDVATTNTVPSNTWTHVLGWWDGTNSKLYVGGSQVGSTVSAPGSLDAGAGNGRIGDLFSGTSKYLGKINDLRVYDRAITTTEIAQLAGAMDTDIVSSGRVAWWRFNGDADTAAIGTDTVTDSSGNGNQGTPSGGPIYRLVS